MEKWRKEQKLEGIDVLRLIAIDNLRAQKSNGDIAGGGVS